MPACALRTACAFRRRQTHAFIPFPCTHADDGPQALLYTPRLSPADSASSEEAQLEPALQRASVKAGSQQRVGRPQAACSPPVGLLPHFSHSVTAAASGSTC